MRLRPKSFEQEVASGARSIIFGIGLFTVAMGIYDLDQRYGNIFEGVKQEYSAHQRQMDRIPSCVYNCGS